MRARRGRDRLPGDRSGTAVQRIRRSPCGRTPAAARGEDDEVRWLTCTQERLLRQHRQHRLRPCSRVDGCRLGLHLLDRAAVGSSEGRDRYRGRC